MVDAEKWSPWYDILGFTVIGPPPLGTIHLPWRRGVHVLYGVNGSGKTTLLRQVNRLVGSRSTNPSPSDGRSFVHIRVHHDATYAGWDFNEAYTLWGLREAIFKYVQRNVLYSDDPGSIVAQGLGDKAIQSLANWEQSKDPQALLAGAVEFLARHAWHGFDPDPALVQEITNPLTLSFESNGAVWISSYLDGHTSLLRGLLEDFSVEKAKHEREQAGKHPKSFVGHAFEEALIGLHSDWIPSMPVPVVQVADREAFDDIYIEGGSVVCDVIRVSGGDPDALTNSSLVGLTKNSEMLEVDGDSRARIVQFTDKFCDFLNEVEDEADRNYRSIMQNSPRLRLKQLEPHEWFNGRIVSWQAETREGALVSLERFSDAERRWAGFAVELALKGRLQGLDRRVTFMIVDEPETALHASALVRLVQDLEETAGWLEGPVLVATHSPQLLEASNSHLLHLQRDPLGRSMVAPLEASRHGEIHEVAARLGLRARDLLQTYRVFLVVEGEHDRIVLSAMFGDDWEQSQIRIVPMSGARNVASVADSDLLLRFTEGHIVVLLDNLSTVKVQEVWQQASELAMGNRAKQARHRIAEFGRASETTPEEEWAASAMDHAIGHFPNRFHLIGLQERDIIEYFEPAVFGLNGAWQALRAEYHEYRVVLRSDESRQARPSDFKSWLRDTLGARINGEVLEQAARSRADDPPRDLVEVLEKCRRIGRPVLAIDDFV